MSNSAPRAAGASAAPRRKLFYRIQEAAEITGLKPYVLRYWETEFPELKPQKDRNDQRRYRPEDLDVVLRIKDLLYGQKYTIAGARQRLKQERSPRSPRREEPAGQEALRTIRRELSELMQSLSA